MNEDLFMEAPIKPVPFKTSLDSCIQWPEIHPIDEDLLMGTPTAGSRC